jgi:hypothetical protein
MLNCLFNIFNFGNLGFVVNLGIVLLLTGLIMLYVKNKFSIYDKCLEEQSNMLRHLVTTLQTQQLRGGNSHYNNELASNVAIDTARRINLNNSLKKNDKIIVSDDETSDADDSTSEYTSDDDNEATDSDSESESDSDSDSESDSDNECENESDNYTDKKELNNKNNELSTKNDDLETIETIETKNMIGLGGVSMIGLNNVNIMSGVQTMGGSLCYLELLSELNEGTSENDLNKCIKVISIKSNENDNNEGKVFELNDSLEVSNVLDESFVVSKVTESPLSEINLNENEYTQLNDSSDKYNLEQLRDMKKTQLQELCKKKNLGTNGTRNELITRLSNVL